MGNVISPEFGVPLDADQLNSSIPISVPYLVTPSNQFIPAQATEDGKLVVSATFSGSITIGEIGAPDKNPFIYGNTLEQTVGGVYQDTNPTLLAGKQGAVRLTGYRAFHVNLRDSSGVEINPATESTLASVNAGLETLNSLVPSMFDYIALSYTGGNLTTATYKTGGAGGSTISILTLAYDGSNNLISVLKS